MYFKCIPGRDWRPHQNLTHKPDVLPVLKGWWWCAALAIEISFFVHWYIIPNYNLTPRMLIKYLSSSECRSLEPTKLALTMSNIIILFNSLWKWKNIFFRYNYVIIFSLPIFKQNVIENARRFNYLIKKVVKSTSFCRHTCNQISNKDVTDSFSTTPNCAHPACQNTIIIVLNMHQDARSSLVQNWVHSEIVVEWQKMTFFILDRNSSVAYTVNIYFALRSVSKYFLIGVNHSSCGNTRFNHTNQKQKR